MDIKISDFLHSYVKQTNRGTCKVCDKSVAWGKEKLSSHKRANCTGITDAEKEIFCKQTPRTSSANESGSSLDVSMNSVSGEEAAPELTAAKKAQIDSALATLCIRTGIPFRTVKSEAFRSFVHLLNPSYAEVMPTPRTVSGVLLDKEYDKSRAKLQSTLTNCNELTLISDGWTNCRGDHIVNYLIKAPGQQTLFYKSSCTMGIAQNADAVAEAIIEILEELGAAKFSCLVTDNAPVLKAAHRIVEEANPNITAFGCAAHVINLLIKDILEPHSSGKYFFLQSTDGTDTTFCFYFLVLSESAEIIKFFNNHHRARALFDSSRQGEESVKKLCVAVPTRWFSQYSSGRSVLEAKYVLAKICDDHEELLKVISATKAPPVIKSIKSPTFWNKLTAVMNLIEFPVNVIGKLEADNAELSLVYHYFGQMLEHYENDRVVFPKVNARWTFLKKNVHGLSYIIVPKYASNGHFIEAKELIVSSIKEFASKINPGQEQETMLEMVQYIREVSALTGDQKALVESMSASDYWEIFGNSKFPLLYKCAKTINGMICTSAAAERAWSIYGFIHTKLRNRLANEKVEKIAFLYINSGFLDGKDKNDYILGDEFSQSLEDFI